MSVVNEGSEANEVNEGQRGMKAKSKSNVPSSERIGPTTPEGRKSRSERERDSEDEQVSRRHSR